MVETGPLVGADKQVNLFLFSHAFLKQMLQRINTEPDFAAALAENGLKEKFIASAILITYFFKSGASTHTATYTEVYNGAQYQVTPEVWNLLMQPLGEEIITELTETTFGDQSLLSIFNVRTREIQS